MLMYIVTKFGADWFISVDARELTKSNAAIFPIQEQITPVVPFKLDP